VPQHISAQTSIPDAWVRQFGEEVAANPTAREGWKKIRYAGIEEGTYFLLWGYAGGAETEINQMHRNTECASERLKAAIRAESIAQTKSPKRAHNTRLFRERANESRENALNAKWPMPSASVRTVGDELTLASELKGRPIPLEAARKAVRRASGERSPVDRMHFLVLLQEYAASHGVKLGLKRLSALADCALPTGYRDGLDAGSLGRAFRSVPQAVRDGIRRDTLPTLPPARSTKK
jgi:hypothetical protein